MKLARNILLVDDEAQWLRTLSITLMRLVPEASIDTCVDSRQVANRMMARDYALVLLDLTMPFHSGEQLLAQIRQQYPNTRVLIVSGVNEVDTAVRCIRSGAYDYFIKTGDVDELALSVRRALEVVGLERSYEQIKARFLSRTLSQPQAFSHILTCEPAMLDRLRYLEALAQSPEPVLLKGEAGVGKGQFAAALQQLINPEQQLTSVTLAGLSVERFEALLYGQVASANGDSAKPGLLHQARGGVLYLQRVGELCLEAQAKLLELLQQEHYFPLGAARPQPLRCRLVFSAQLNLLELQQQGRFRADLLYRLRGHRLTVPPLRQRTLDLPILIGAFIEEAAQQMARPAPLQSPELAQRLSQYAFPGNLAELRGMVFDAVSRSDEQRLNEAPFIEAMNDHHSDAPQPTIQFGQQLPSLAELGQALVEEAMSRTAHNQTAAAKLLGISQSALSRRLAKTE
ncbi:sigma 54-interacting transcriptional regulator [uncultured Ferrimonas sp.]|uniref:sigma-54-dependent transcriptional regulator n=1 Tax=uncultured Ferrimonas sp. TaxID=432640 RepID=UPI002626EA10|nr:sigma 54-interacting transcriptional regulator [uncultured Ferrimonas sp.]